MVSESWVWALDMLFGLCVLVVAFFVHEHAHKKRAWMLGREARVEIRGLRWRTFFDTTGLCDREVASVYVWGVFCGGVVVGVLGLFLMPWTYLGVLACYVWACRSDFRELKALEEA